MLHQANSSVYSVRFHELNWEKVSDRFDAIEQLTTDLQNDYCFDDFSVDSDLPIRDKTIPTVEAAEQNLIDELDDLVSLLANARSVHSRLKRPVKPVRRSVSN